MLVTSADLERDYLTIEEIAKQFDCAPSTVTRWRRKYFDKAFVEVSGGRYFVHKDEVERWRQKYGDTKPVRGRRLGKL